jgi:hydrogenase nickel incorporation protein HypA/HybF
MHERAPIGRQAARLLARLSDSKSLPSVITVGVASDVNLDTARDAWDAATGGTRLAGIPVEWVVRHATLACLTCSGEYVGDKLDRCPTCGGDGLIIDDPPTAEVVSLGPVTT